jgi:cell division septal protein FtsQ
LEQVPAIASATIQPSLSGNIYVHVAERQPVMIWDSEGQQILADADGTALREGLRDLPILYGNVGGPIPIGGRLDFSAVQVIQAIAPRLHDLGLEEGRLEWDTHQGVSVLAEGARVILGSYDQIEAKLDAYQAIRQRLEQGRISAQVIDVRSLDRPYFR